MSLEVVYVSAIVSILVLQIAILRIVYWQGREMGEQKERLTTAVDEISQLREKGHEVSKALQRLIAIEEQRH